MTVGVQRVAYSRLPILKRLIPSLRKRRAWFTAPESYRLVKREGVVFLANYAGWADKMAVIHGLAEYEQLHFLLREIGERQCNVFLDIGAHMGTYAIMVAHKTRCQRIVAFEPDPRNYAHLQANLLVNGLIDVIESKPVAVSDLDGSVSFVLGPATHDVWSRVADDTESTLRVPAARLDSIVECRAQSIALKIDIEGHELRALTGMQGLLANNRCFMQVECFDDKLPAFQAAMARLGYRLTHAIGPDRYFTN